MTYSEQAATRGEPGYVWRSGQDRRLAMVQKRVDLTGRVLDNGCGLGTWLEALKPYSRQRFGLELELERAMRARARGDGVVQGVGEFLPFHESSVDAVLSNEVIEHVDDDRLAVREMVRVVRPGGWIVIFCPNRWYPVEQHGVYWRGRYKFGNIPLINYLPNSIRDRLAPHVRTYTTGRLLALTQGLPVDVMHHSRIYGGYDNIEQRWPRFGQVMKKVLYAAERTPLSALGLSHFLVLQKRG